MRWTIKLEASTEWGDTQTFEIGRLERPVAGLASHEVGLTLDEAKALLVELQRRIVQSQIGEKVSVTQPRSYPARRFQRLQPRDHARERHSTE